MAATALREEYEDSMDRLIAGRRIELDAQRREYTQQILAALEEACAQFVQMLGWPLTEYTPAQPLQVRTEQLHTSEEAVITRVQLELWPDFWFGGLLMLHPDGARRPFVLSQHGGSDTPELCSGMLEMGSANYNGMSRRAFDLGANVFATQLFLWNNELFGKRVDQSGADRSVRRREMDASLKNLGGSIMALELT